jgi:hypothetical protein
MEMRRRWKRCVEREADIWRRCDSEACDKHVQTDIVKRSNEE